MSVCRKYQPFVYYILSSIYIIILYHFFITLFLHISESIMYAQWICVDLLIPTFPTLWCNRQLFILHFIFYINNDLNNNILAFIWHILNSICNLTIFYIITFFTIKKIYYYCLILLLRLFISDAYRIPLRRFGLFFHQFNCYGVNVKTSEI